MGQVMKPSTQTGFTPPSARQRAEAIIAAWNQLTRWEAECFTDFACRELWPGSPPPPFTSVEAEAEAWARFAPEETLRVYVVAAFVILPAAARKRLLAILRRLP